MCFVMLLCSVYISQIGLATAYVHIIYEQIEVTEMKLVPSTKTLEKLNNKVKI